MSAQPVKGGVPLWKNPAVAGRLAVTFAAVEGAHSTYQKVRSFWTERYAYKVTVHDSDPTYREVHRWLLRVMPEQSTRRLAIGADSDHGMVEEDGDPGVAELPITYDGRHPRTIYLGRHRLRVEITKSEDTKYRARKRIEFTTGSAAGRDAILEHLRSLQKQVAVRKPRLHQVTTWGSWQTSREAPQRSLASVVLEDGQMERIVDDMGRFLDSERRYTEIGAPWHRGYLFHGPPGTGKSSIPKALASHFGLDLWYMGLADMSKEASFANLVSEVKPRSLLLLEDVDTVQMTHERSGSKAKAGQISLGSMLNVLDGVMTPHGLIVIMTTNDKSVLDPALIRPGRMDMTEEIGLAGPREVARLFRHVYGEDLVYGGLNRRLQMSEVVEVMKRNLDDPKRAAYELHEVMSS